MAAIDQVRKTVFEQAVKDPEAFAKALLAAARRLKSKRAGWRKYKKRHLARLAHKKIPRK